MAWSQLIPALVAFLAAIPETCAVPTRANVINKAVTSSGTLLGYHAANRPSVSEYLGIPYAKPPVGNLRFARPEAFNGNTTIEASDYSPLCPYAWQPVNYTAITSVGFVLAEAGRNELEVFRSSDVVMSEDCLTLNIWAKQTAVKDKAVLVFIHGGSFATAGSDSPYFDGEFLADDEDIVVVTLNYRLNVLGFPGISGHDQNLGLLDQRLAIEWIRDNIAAFGGSSERITIAGQSAGSASVDFYSYAWVADPIVNGFIESSGTVTAFQYPPTDNLEAWLTLIETLDCGSSESPIDDTIDCVRQKPWQEVIASLPGGGIALGPFSPSIDNITVFSKQEYSAKNQAGEFIHRPYIIGDNDYEGGSGKVIFAESGQVMPEPFYWLYNLAAFTCPSRTAALARAVNDVPIWRYRYFGEFENLRLLDSPNSGAHHGSEIPVWFGTTEQFGIENTAAETKVVSFMKNAWAEFAKDPASALQDLGWPKFDVATRPISRLSYENQVGFHAVDSVQYDGVCPQIDAMLDFVGGLGALAGIVAGGSGGDGMSELLILLAQFNITLPA